MIGQGAKNLKLRPRISAIPAFMPVKIVTTLCLRLFPNSDSELLTMSEKRPLFHNLNNSLKTESIPIICGEISHQKIIKSFISDEECRNTA